MNSTTIGLAAVLVAGAIGSATLLPTKFVRRWAWENMWLIFALFAYLILPLAIALLTVPSLSKTYLDVSAKSLVLVGLFGLGWGISVVMLGLAVAAAGLAVANAIILGCSIVLGSLVPLLLYGPATSNIYPEMRIILANAVLFVGVLLCALAGYWRDTMTCSPNEAATVRGGGLLLCFVAGVLTPLLNLALAAGGTISEAARKLGAAEYHATNAVWALAVGIGAIPSAVYCATLLTKNRTWHNYSLPGSSRNLLLCVLMGTLFITSTIGYGAGALRMGKLGPAIGWPVYVSSLLIGNAFWGWLTGEWSAAPRRAIATMFAGILAQIVGITLLFAIAPPESTDRVVSNATLHCPEVFSQQG